MPAGAPSAQAGQKSQQAGPKSWVYRDVKQMRTAADLLPELQSSISKALCESPSCSAVLDALVRCGELECALADGEWEDMRAVCELTDALAELLVGGGKDAQSRAARTAHELTTITEAGELRISPPEGFAYYALHPLDFATLADRFAQHTSIASVIGIRSIGTVLSAVVKASFRQRGGVASRITVRPRGEAYNRVTEFDAEQSRWIREQQERAAHFFIVDEGPGLSGSSFLSVAEELLGKGIRREGITLLGSREAEPRMLCTADAERRWAQFDFHRAQPQRYATVVKGIDISGGHWRRHLLPEKARWPACWGQVERLKLLGQDESAMFKFEGIGFWGSVAEERGRAVAEARFGPEIAGSEEGLIAYQRIQLRLPVPEFSGHTISRLARYCAFRTREFRSTMSADANLADMVRFNAEEELGRVPDIDLSCLGGGPTILCDGRMQEHEWVGAADGRWLKCDGVSHGDDHFFPGPVDVAWDLAGAIVEWKMSQAAADLFLREFCALSGDDARSRIDAFTFSYSVFRMAYTSMALHSIKDPEERSRFSREHLRYKVRAESIANR